jgi:hypothetical protein
LTNCIEAYIVFSDSNSEGPSSNIKNLVTYIYLEPFFC